VRTPPVRLVSPSSLASGCLGTTLPPPAQTSTPNTAWRSWPTPTNPAHIAFLTQHTEDILFSPNAISFIRQQREHFIEQLQISVAHIEALIVHQQALSRIFNNIPIDPNTGPPSVHTGVVTTAFCVNEDTTRRDPPVRSTVAPSAQRSRFQFYAVRRGYAHFKRIPIVGSSSRPGRRFPK
jgi:hypothetical protein